MPHAHALCVLQLSLSIHSLRHGTLRSSGARASRNSSRNARNNKASTLACVCMLREYRRSSLFLSLTFWLGVGIEVGVQGMWPEVRDQTAAHEGLAAGAHVCRTCVFVWYIDENQRVWQCQLMAFEWLIGDGCKRVVLSSGRGLTIYV